MRGETDVERINIRVGVQVKQLTQALKNLGLEAYTNATVADWSFLRDDPRFFTLLASLKELTQNDVEVHRNVVETATKLTHRFRSAQQRDSDDPTELQITYILEETALSLYITEIRGFNIEVYRRGMGFIDYLYADRPMELKSLLGRPALTRKFVSIENWLAVTADASLLN
jgi:tRNA-dependent cyclodipeptide synthase